MKAPVTAAILTCVALGACVRTMGPQPRDYGPAHTASGVHAEVFTATDHMGGELLEVRDSAIVLHGAATVLIPFDAIVRAAFADTRLTVDRTSHERAEVTQIRLLSRYPQGMPLAALHAYLSAANQDSLIVRR
jgi:hypothetical protein